MGYVREFCNDCGKEHLKATVCKSPSMQDAIIAANDILLNEQAKMLRECRSAIVDLLEQRPMLGALKCGSTTLGNLRIELEAMRPSGIFDGISK